MIKNKKFKKRSRKAQELSKARFLSSKRAQEEMIGFALIIILVSVILLAFLGFSLSKSPGSVVKSYEVENFIQAFLQYTTDCQKNSVEYFAVKDLIFECDSKKKCLNEERTACEALNSTMKDVLDESWLVGNGSKYQGYQLMIDVEREESPEILNIQEGNITRSYKGSSVPLPKRGKKVHVTFNVYT